MLAHERRRSTAPQARLSVPTQGPPQQPYLCRQRRRNRMIFRAAWSCRLVRKEPLWGEVSQSVNHQWRFGSRDGAGERTGAWLCSCAGGGCGLQHSWCDQPRPRLAGVGSCGPAQCSPASVRASRTATAPPTPPCPALGRGSPLHPHRTPGVSLASRRSAQNKAGCAVPQPPAWSWPRADTPPPRGWQAMRVGGNHTGLATSTPTPQISGRTSLLHSLSLNTPSVPLQGSGQGLSSSTLAQGPGPRGRRFCHLPGSLGLWPLYSHRGPAPPAARSTRNRRHSKGHLRSACTGPGALEGPHLTPPHHQRSRNWPRPQPSPGPLDQNARPLSTGVGKRLSGVAWVAVTASSAVATTPPVLCHRGEAPQTGRTPPPRPPPCPERTSASAAWRLRRGGLA